MPSCACSRSDVLARIIVTIVVVVVFSAAVDHPSSRPSWCFDDVVR